MTSRTPTTRPVVAMASDGTRFMASTGDAFKDQDLALDLYGGRPLQPGKSRGDIHMGQEGGQRQNGDNLGAVWGAVKWRASAWCAHLQRRQSRRLSGAARKSGEASSNDRAGGAAAVVTALLGRQGPRGATIFYGTTSPPNPMQGGHLDKHGRRRQVPYTGAAQRTGPTRGPITGEAGEAGAAGADGNRIFFLR